MMRLTLWFRSVLWGLGIWLFVVGCSCQEGNKGQTVEGASQSNSRESQAFKPFDPDTEHDSVSYEKLYRKNGPLILTERKYRLGAVMKFFGNPYWQEVARGMKKRADDFSAVIDIQAATSISSPENQLHLMEIMISKGYDAILISPQTKQNLIPAVNRARNEGILVINIDDAVSEDVVFFVGSNHYQMGIHAAEYFIHGYPEGGEVALLQGLIGAYSAAQRSQGFIDRLEGSSVRIVAQPYCDWDLQKALEASLDILRKYPDIKGFYCNNDVMALGAAEAVKRMDRKNSITIIGTDGIPEAYDAVKKGDFAATIDSFPYLTGFIAVDVTLRILEGQQLPRVIYSPHQLVTQKNMDKHSPDFPFLH